MTAPAPWWTTTDGDGFVAPRPQAGERVTGVTKVSDDRYCTTLTATAKTALGIGWGCIDTSNEADAQRVSELVARLVAALRELGDA